MTKNKRKAGGSQSPPERPSKRRSGVQTDEVDNSDGEEDPGREESQEMMVVLNRFKQKDDGWTKRMHQEIDANDKALNDLLDKKDRELAQVDSQFHDEIRNLLLDVLSGPDAGAAKRPNNQGPLDPRPAFDHAQLLFDKSRDLLQSYDNVNKGIAKRGQDIATEQPQQFEKDNIDVAELLHIGQEVTRHRIEDILSRSGERDTPRKKTKDVYTSDKLVETANIFDSLRDERQGQDLEEETDTKPDMVDTPGVYPLIRNAKKGVKKLAGKLLFE